MSGPGYYRLAIEGEYQAQAITNVLFYGSIGGAPFSSWTSAMALDLIDVWGETFLPEYVNPLPTAYNLNNLSVSYVDARGVTDPTTFQVNVGQNVPGTQAVSTDTQALVAVIAFNTDVAVGATLPMKRSYIAYGPLQNAYVGDNAKIQPTGLTAINPIADLLNELMVGSVGSFYPVRVGRTVAPAPIRVGRVLSAFVRPTASFRRSRLPKPTAP